MLYPDYFRVPVQQAAEILRACDVLELLFDRHDHLAYALFLLGVCRIARFCLDSKD